MFMLNIPSLDTSDLAVIRALYLKYNTYDTDREMMANPTSHKVSPLQLGIKYESLSPWFPKQDPPQQEIFS